MQPSPKKSVGPNIATTASFPDPFTTDSFTPPFCTYITLSAASPCVKMDSLLRYSEIFLATPAVSRNSCGSKAPPFPFFFGFCDFIVGPKHPLDTLETVVSRPYSPYQEHPLLNCIKGDSARQR